MYSTFVRLFTIVLDKLSQPELLVLSKLYNVQDFFFCYDFEFHSHIGWGPKIFFVCSMKEVVNMNAIGQIFCNSGKRGIKRIGNVYWLIYSFTIWFKFTRKICLFPMSIYSSITFQGFFLIIFISSKLSLEVIDFCFIFLSVYNSVKSSKICFLYFIFKTSNWCFFSINVFLIFTINQC